MKISDESDLLALGLINLILLKFFDKFFLNSFVLSPNHILQRKKPFSFKNNFVTLNALSCNSMIAS
jgi:hypothetical protein